MDYMINVNGRLMDLSQPQVMGILNVTPDSFYEGSRMQTEREIAERANQIISEGATMIDVGAYSTRPGASEVSQAEEMERLRFGLDVVRRELPWYQLTRSAQMWLVWLSKSLVLASSMMSVVAMRTCSGWYHACAYLIY